jgi:hypothetical protein
VVLVPALSAFRLDRDGPTLKLAIEVFAQLPEARTERLGFTEVSDLEIGGIRRLVRMILEDVGYEIAGKASDGVRRWRSSLEGQPAYREEASGS